MVTYMVPCYSLNSSHPLFLRLCPQLCSLCCISTAALQIGSSVPSFWIPYVCVNIQYLSCSFGLTSLCIIGSRFSHLIRTNSNVFFFITERICYVTQGAQPSALWQPGEAGWGGKWRGAVQEAGASVYLWLTHADVWQKPIQSCKAIILQ